LGLGNKLALVYIISTCLSILTLGLWSVLAARWGKKTTWGIALGLISVGFVSAGLLVPGESSFMPLMMINTLVVLGFAAYSILVPSMLADIIDYGTWKSGIELGATYFSVFTLMGKATMAIGGALGLFVAGGYGFDPTISMHTADAIFGLRLAIAWLPALIILLALVFVALIPINARRHVIIRRRLDVRASRTQAAEKQTLVKTVNTHSHDTVVLSSSEMSLTSQL
jgi:Na+/melibiose symporter-like transporter